MAFLSSSYEENIKQLDHAFENCADIISLELNLEYMGDSRGKIYFVESAVSNVTIRKVVLGLSDVFPLETMEDVISTIMTGNAALIIDGKNYALKIRTS